MHRQEWLNRQKIIKIVQVKSRERIPLPKEARDKLKINENEYIAFLEDDMPGIRVMKVVLDLRGGENNDGTGEVAPSSKTKVK